MTKLADKIEALEGPVPDTAEFTCAPYSDGKGHEVLVSYDVTDNEPWNAKICLNGLTVTFSHEYAEDVIAAIRYCAAALRTREANR